MYIIRFYKNKDSKNKTKKPVSFLHHTIGTFILLIIILSILLYNSPFVHADTSYPQQVVLNPSAQTSDDTLLSYRKSIEQTDKDAFTINLDVVTRQNIKTIGGKSGSVVLVLDNSGSMGRGDAPTPGDYARDALKEFGDQFLNHGHSKNKLGLVTYSSSYGDNTLYDAYDEVTYHTGASMTSDSTVFDTVVDKLDPPNGETNVQMGIKIARNILAADTSLNPKFIVLFSDGSANRSASPITAEPLGASQIIPYTYGGKTYDMSFKFTQFNYSKLGSFSYSDSSYTTNHTNAHLVATVSEALLAQDSGINMYSIFYRNPGLDDLEYGQGVFVMKNANASGHYIEISPGDVANFADIFSEIEKEIEESISPWLIEDPMADYIEFAGFNDTRLAGANFDPGTRTLKWNLQSTEAEADGDGNYHYHLSYNIVLNTNDEGFQNNFAYPTNNTTTLTYQKTTDPDTYSEHQVTFIVPTVKGVSENTKLLHVKALDMIAYQDGNSASGDPFPRPYFAFFWDDNGTPGAQLSQEELDTLVFTLDAAPFVPNEHPYFIYDYPFRVQYVNQETNVVHNDPDALDESPGIYTFRFSTQDNDTKHTYTVAALDREGTSYDFRFFQNGQLEVREQSESPTLYTPYETGAPADDFITHAPTVFIQEGTELYNTAGIPLYQSQIANITLLSDGLLDSEQTALANVLSQRADMQNKTYTASYLQLVDNEDGNIVVEATTEVSIFYPYPQGTGSSTAFTVLHFNETHRAVNAPPIYSASEPLSITKLDTGLVFKTSGNMKGFGPFVIAYSNDSGHLILPESGGSGTTLFTIAGLVLVIGAVLILLLLKNKN